MIITTLLLWEKSITKKFTLNKKGAIGALFVGKMKQYLSPITSQW